MGVECVIAQVNKLLVHYGCTSNLGLKLKISLSKIILELGISSQPLQESYQQYSNWITHSWLKSLWEKCDLLGIMVEFNNITLCPPRERDKWLMREFIQLGYSPQALLCLNQMRLNQQV